MSISVKANAKINLSLDIVGTRSDGYHLLRSVMQSVDLHDVITVSLKSGEIKIICDDKNVPTDRRNTVYKACECFFKAVNSKSGAIIEIEKHIPSEAGLGGASADAAAVLWALNTLSDEKLTEKELFEVGANVGADVPFCMKSGTALCEGIGEVLTELPPIPDCSILIAKPDVGISTAKAYALFDKSESLQKEYTDEIISAINDSDIHKIAKNLGNAFEALAGVKEIFDIKDIMLSCGAYGSCMSGSGSAVFGIFGSKEKSRICERKLLNKKIFAKVCKPTK